MGAQEGRGGEDGERADAEHGLPSLGKAEEKHSRWTAVCQWGCSGIEQGVRSLGGGWLGMRRREGIGDLRFEISEVKGAPHVHAGFLGYLRLGGERSDREAAVLNVKTE